MRFTREAISRFGHNYTQTAKSGELVFTCPKCNREKLYVNTYNGVFHCFRCDYAGRIKGVAELSDVINKQNKQSKAVDREVRLLPFNVSPLSYEQHEALLKRGLTDDDIKYYGICGGNRIQIPNRVLGNLSDLVCNWEWQKDKITKTNPKYLYTKGVEKSNVVFNIHRIPKGSQVFLCEGIFNAITAGRNGIASYGRSLSDRQLEIILDNKPSCITVAYDSDLPGVTGSVKALEMLANSNYTGRVEYILLPKGVDINDLGKEKFQEYYNNNKVCIDLQSGLSMQLPMLLYKNQTRSKT